MKRYITQLLTLAFFAAMISSCSTNIRAIDPATHTVPVISSSWVKVRSKPPTWFPQGIAANHPTGYRDGSWIHAEDSLGTRFFIPARGLSSNRREHLLSEALAARHPERLRSIAKEDINYTSGKIAARITAITFLILMDAGRSSRNR